jgi:hypothetical protein
MTGAILTTALLTAEPFGLQQAIGYAYLATSGDTAWIPDERWLAPSSANSRRGAPARR